MGASTELEPSEAPFADPSQQSQLPSETEDIEIEILNSAGQIISRFARSPQSQDVSQVSNPQSSPSLTQEHTQRHSLKPRKRKHKRLSRPLRPRRLKPSHL